MFSPVPDQSVLQRSGARNSMRRERMTSKIARCLAMAMIALVLLTAHLLTLAQSTGPTQPHRTAVLHPAPTPAKPPSVATGAQALKCQPVKLLLLLHEHDMPNVVGCPRAVVDRSLKQADLGAAKPVLLANDASNGVVFRQDPLPGRRVMSNTQVTLYISTGPAPQPPPPLPPPPESEGPPAPAATVSPGPKKRAMTTVPAVRGVAEARALVTIEKSRLRPIFGGKEFSEIPRGRMIRTDPPAGRPVAQGSLVSYWESLGRAPPPPPPPVPPPVPPPASTVPSVIGQTPAEAVETLQAAGFAAGEPIPELTLSGTGRISRQDPLAGSPLAQRQQVLLWRSYAWLSTMSLAVVPLLILGSLAGLALTHIRAKRRLAYTRAVLRIQPSLARDGETPFVRTIPPAGPALGLRASLQPGEVHFAGPVPIERREIQHD